MQWVLLARQSDLSKLTAGDLRLVKDRKKGEIIIVTFKGRKNDSSGETTTLIIPSNPSGLICPLKVVKLYFKRFNLMFWQPSYHSQKPIFHRFTCSKWIKSEKYIPSNIPVSRNTLNKEVKESLASIGFTGKMTLTSAKRAGVSRAFELGLNENQVRDLGGWKDSRTCLLYKKQDIKVKTSNAKSLVKGLDWDKMDYDE